MRGGFSVSRRILVGCTHSWLYLLKVGFNGMLIIFDKLAVIEQSHFLVQFVLLCFKLSFQVSQWNKVIWFFHTKHYLFLFTFLLPVLFHLHCFRWQFWPKGNRWEERTSQPAFGVVEKQSSFKAIRVWHKITVTTTEEHSSLGCRLISISTERVRGTTSKYQCYQNPPTLKPTRSSAIQIINGAKILTIRLQLSLQ